MQPTGHDSNNRSPSVRLTLAAIFVVLTLTAGAFAVGDVWTRTLNLGLAASAIAIPLGMTIRWVIRQGGRIGGLLTLACLVSTMLPMVIHVGGWDAAIGKLGWLTTARGNVLTPLLSGWWAAVWTHGLIAAPQIGLLLHFCENKLDRVYEKQALLEADGWTTFWSVTLWRLWPMLMVSVLWVIVTCSREITVVDLYQVETFAEQIYLGYSLGNGNGPGVWPAAIDTEINVGFTKTAIYVSLLAVAAVVTFIVLTDSRRPNENDTIATTTRSNRLAATVGMLLLLLLVAVPAANVFIRASFYVDSVDGQLTQNYSIDQVFRAMRKSCLDYRWEMIWSLVISLASATTAIVCSITLVRWTSGSTVKRLVFAMIVACGLALPGPVTGSVLAQAFAIPTWPWFVWLVNYTIFAPVVATTIFTFPLIALAIWFVLHQTPQTVTEAASLDGLNAGESFWRIRVAGNLKMVVGCWLLACVLCFGELSASQIVRPAGMDTVARKMLGDLHAGVNELTAGISIVVAAAAVVVSLAGWSVIRIGTKK